MSRPENRAPPELFYNEEEAAKYATSSRMQRIQTEMSERAIELLNLPEDHPCLILDLGCGSGLSGDALAESGHSWIGMDISSSMLDIASERDVDGDLVLGDMGQGVPFRPGVFDGCISISALQWLCWANKSSENPVARLKALFNTLYHSMARGARCVFQLYPDSPEQMSLITEVATRAGFSGGLVIDYPHSAKAKKYFLCLFAGVVAPNMPRGLGTTGAESASDEVGYGGRERDNNRRRRGKSRNVKSKDWVMNKKARQRAQGKEVKRDSRYTARRRPAGF